MTDTQPSNTERGARNFRAAGYMLLAVVVASLAPVFFHVGKASQYPYVFNAISKLSQCVGLILFLLVLYNRELFDREIWRAVRKNLRSWVMFAILMGTFDYAYFGWSLKFIDISVATILYETWPLWAILLIKKMFEKEYRYESIDRFGWICILMAFGGLGFVIVSQTGELTLDGETVSKNDFIFGISLALISAGLSALLGYTLKWGVNVMDSVPKLKDSKKDMALFFSLIGIMAAFTVSAVIQASFGVFVNNEIIETDNAVYPFVFGLLMSIGVVYFRKALFTTTKLEINAMSYATPIFSLIWLGMLGYINAPRADWLVIGAMGVVAANTLLNFKAERRLAYQSLVVALWVCGVVVYFRSFWHAHVFYETVAVVTTMFILILSFRVDRLVRRTSDEDKLTLEIWQKISSLPKYLQDKLCEIDEAQTPKKLGEAHKDFHDSLKKECADKKEFSDIMQQVNILSHSKQQGDNFGEHAVLWILGGISVGGLWFFIPEGVNAESGAGGFFLEIAAFLVSATVIFLLFNIQDLQQDRKHQMLRTKSDTESPDETNKYEGLVFREDQDRIAARRISIVFCVGIVATFGILFWLKWMPI